MDLIKVVDAKYKGEYKIEFTFNEGTQKIIDLEKELWGEVFKPLKDKNKFKNFKLNPFTIEWEGGADFAPEYLYELATKKELTQKS